MKLNIKSDTWYRTKNDQILYVEDWDWDGDSKRWRGYVNTKAEKMLKIKINEDAYQEYMQRKENESND